MNAPYGAFLSERTTLWQFRRYGMKILLFSPESSSFLIENSISDLVELIRGCGGLHSNEILEFTSRSGKSNRADWRPHK